ncbi:MAG: amidohydrolase family protein, partial [Pseudomonadota bacterium]
MLDLTLHEVRLPEAPDEVVDVGVAGGKIADIRPGLEPGVLSHRFDGRILVPGFCESHIHLDKSCILDSCTMRGGLPDAIAEVARLKGAFTPDDVAERASRTLRKCVVNGTMKMRTHVEVDPTIGMTGIEGVTRAVRDWAFAIDVEVCVFPQEGLLNNPGTDELMVEALSTGAAQSIGAAPYTDSDPHGQIDRIFELAREYDAEIDMHLDFGTDPDGLHVEYVARQADAFGWGGRVAVGHVTRFAQLAPDQLAPLSRRLADAGVAVTVLPATDLFLMHRDHDANLSAPRGVTPLHKMLAHGVTCSLSTNNVLNPFTPFGDCSLLRMANLYANTAQVDGRDSLADCLAMITTGSAKLMNLSGYGIAIGHPADFV